MSSVIKILFARVWGWRIILNALMKTPVLICCLIVLCTTATAIAADTTNSVVESKAQKIQRLMKITGARQIARQSAGQIIGQFREMQPNLPIEFWNEFLSETNLDELFGIAASIYDKSFSDEEVTQLIAFYDSPVGRKITTLLPDLTKQMLNAGQKWGAKVGEKAARKIQTIQELQVNLLKTQAERRHWTEQLERIRQGKEWYGVEGYDKSWNLVLTDAKQPTTDAKSEVQKSLDNLTRSETDTTTRLAEFGFRLGVGSASDGKAFVTKVKSDKDDVLILENGGIVKISSGYLGYVGYRKDAVLFKSGSSWFIWVSGKKAYKCELIDSPAGKAVPATKTSVKQVKGNGSFVETDDGSIYQVDQLNTITTALWFGTTEVLILDDSKMLNLSTGGEMVDVTKLK